MNVNLSDELKNLKITFQLSVDSICVGGAGNSCERVTAANSVTVTARSDGGFDVDIDATTCKVWAKWFAVTGAGTIAIAPNPFENDGGSTFLDAYSAPIPTKTIRPNLTGGTDTVLVRVWSLDTGAAAFGAPRDGRAHVFTSSSSSSSSSVSSNSSNSTSSISSGSMSSSNSTGSMSSLSSTPSSPSMSSTPSSPSVTSSSSLMVTHGKSKR